VWGRITVNFYQKEHQQRLASCPNVHISVCNIPPLPPPVLLPLFKPVFFPFVEQVRLRTPKIDDLRTAVSVFFLLCTLLAVVGIRDPLTAANHTAAFVRTVVTLVTNTDQCAGADVRIANHALTITFFTKSPNSYSRLLAAHDQIGVMLCHFSRLNH